MMLPGAPCRSRAAHVYAGPYPLHCELCAHCTAQMPPSSSMHAVPPGQSRSSLQWRVHSPSGQWLLPVTHRTMQSRFVVQCPPTAPGGVPHAASSAEAATDTSARAARIDAVLDMAALMKARAPGRGKMAPRARYFFFICRRRSA